MTSGLGVDDGKTSGLCDARGPREQLGTALPDVRLPPHQPAAGSVWAPVLHGLCEGALQVSASQGHFFLGGGRGSSVCV